jgi:YidC/Oxa1 family membrane protein insertase
MFLYEWVNNYGLAILLFAVIVRVILLPFQMKSKPGMMRQTRLQPKVAEIQKKYASNKAKVNEELTKFYKDEGVSPASGCIWAFLPLPIMIALFLAIRQPLTMMMGIPESLLQRPAIVSVPEGEREVKDKGAPETKILLTFPDNDKTYETKIDANGTWKLPDEVTPKPEDKIVTVREDALLTRKLQELGYVFPERPDAYEQVKQAQFITNSFEQFQSLDIKNLRALDFNFLGINLGAQPQWNFLWSTDWSNSEIWLPGLILFLIPLLSGGLQFIASAINKKISPPPAQDGQGQSMQTMLVLMPLMSVAFAFGTPAALGFYWSIGTVIQIAQDVWLTKRYTRILDAEDAVRNDERQRKEAEIEAKRIETERKKAEGLAVERNPNTSKRKKQKTEKQEQIDKAAEWEKKHTPADDGKYEPGRVGNRRYARGRSYDPDRYTRASGDDVRNENSKFRTQNPELSDGIDDDSVSYDVDPDDADLFFDDGSPEYGSDDED